MFLPTPLMKMELKKSSETSAHKIQMPENHPSKKLQQLYSYTVHSSTNALFIKLGKV